MQKADVDRALGILTSAFPSQPFDAASSEIYGVTLAEKVRSPEILYAVVADWISGRTVFPKIAELLEACADEERRRVNRQNAIYAGQDAKRAGMISCGNCQDTFWELDDQDGYTVAIPCRVCRPTRHQDWRDGHIALDHDFENCDWILCQQRVKQGKRKPRGEVLVPTVKTGENF